MPTLQGALRNYNLVVSDVTSTPSLFVPLIEKAGSKMKDVKPWIYAMVPFLGCFAAGYAISSYGPSIGYRFRQAFIDMSTFELDGIEKDMKNGTTTWKCRVHASEIDHNGHMNNAAFIRELNFSRRHHFTAVGLWKIMNKYGRNVLVACQTIRYRKEMLLGMAYQIRTKIVGYSDRESTFWLQSQFEDMKGENVYAVHILKYKLISRNDTKSLRSALPPSMLLIEVGLGGIVPNGDVEVVGNVPQIDACSGMNVLHRF
jgi:acyl-CoA thioesterase FadM